MRQNNTGRATAQPIPFYQKLLETYPLLSNDAYLALLEAYRAGSIATGVRIVMHSVQFSIWKAHKFARRGVPMEDLVQVGLNDLWRFAVDKFDPTRASWRTYANYWLRHSMHRTIQNTRVDRAVRIPVNEDELRAHVVRVRDRFYTRHGRKIRSGELLSEVREAITSNVRRRFRKTEGRAPTEAELAEKVAGHHCCPMTVEQVDAVFATDLFPFSFDAMIFPESALTFADVTPDPTVREKWFELAGCSGDVARAEEFVRTAVRRLDERSQRVLRHRFGWNGTADQSLEEVGAEMALSKERIRQLESDAIRRLASILQRTPEEVTIAMKAIGELTPTAPHAERRRRQLPTRSL